MRMPACSAFNHQKMTKAFLRHRKILEECSNDSTQEGRLEGSGLHFTCLLAERAAAAAIEVMMIKEVRVNGGVRDACCAA